MLYLIFDCEMNGGKFVRKIRMDDFFFAKDLESLGQNREGSGKVGTGIQVGLKNDVNKLLDGKDGEQNHWLVATCFPL